MRAGTAAVGLCMAVAVHAQEPPSTQMLCRGQRIDAIEIATLAPTVTGVQRIPLVGKIVRETHVVTRDDVVRRFLLFRTSVFCARSRFSRTPRSTCVRAHMAASSSA